MIQGRHPVWGILKEKVALGTEQGVSVADRAEAAGPDLQSAEVRQVLEKAYGGAIKNGLQICAIFTAGLEDRHNYRDQLRDSFPQVAFGDQLRLEYFHDSDHMFTSEAARERLVDLVADWANGTVFPLEGQPRSSRIEA